MRKTLIRLAECAAFLAVSPLLFWSRLPLKEYSAFTAPSQLLSLVPGLLGVLLRRVWYRFTLHACGANLTVDWMGVIRTRRTEVGNRCTVGVGSWINWARLGNDVMLGDHVTILSGGKQHSFDALDIPMREQRAEKIQVRIADDVWLGSRSVILADVSEGTVVGAGAVVTRTYEKLSVLAGVPARPIRKRTSGKE